MLCRRLLINFSKMTILENVANMQNVSEFEKSSIRKNWRQDSANDLSRGSLRSLWTSALSEIADQFFEDDDFGKRS